MKLVLPAILLIILAVSEMYLSYFIPKVADNYQHDYKKIDGSVYNKRLYEVSSSVN